MLLFLPGILVYDVSFFLFSPCPVYLLTYFLSYFLLLGGGLRGPQDTREGQRTVLSFYHVDFWNSNSSHQALSLVKPSVWLRGLKRPHVAVRSTVHLYWGAEVILK